MAKKCIVCVIVVILVACFFVAGIITLSVYLAEPALFNGQTGSQDEFVEVTGDRGAVATDDKRCSEAGLDVLNNGGNAVDAAVASLLCLGVVNFHSSGIGGGMMMLVGKKSSSAPGGYSVKVIDARERAPISAMDNQYKPVDAAGKNFRMTTG